MLKHAKAEGRIKVLPTAEVKRLKRAAVKRELFTAADLETLCAAAVAQRENGEPVAQNGAQLCDYLRLMAYSGARASEAMALRWCDVISYAVMSGIDYMTIASWVGHQDGGCLIGKVYGHLADTHKKAAAARLNFGPAIVEAEQPTAAV